MFFDGEALLAPRQTPKQEDHPSSAVRDCLFNIFAATLHVGTDQEQPTSFCNDYKWRKQIHEKSI